jgi:hypothetical protein
VVGDVTRFRHLLAGDNPGLGDAGAVSLAKALHRHAGLVALSLPRCGLGKPAALALAAALTENDCLQSLDLAENSLGPDGGQALGLALKRNEVGDEREGGQAAALIRPPRDTDRFCLIAWHWSSSSSQPMTQQ